VRRFQLQATDRRRALASVVAVVALLAAGYAGAGFAATSGAAGPTDTTPPPETTPTPDPAPPPAPKTTPKPTPPPPPPPVSHPAPVYHAPAPTHTHTYTPPRTYTPPTPHSTYTPPVVHHSKPKVVHHRTHKRKKTVVQTTPLTTTQAQAHNPKPTYPFTGGVQTAATTSAGDSARSMLIVVGLGLAAFLFFLVWAIPTTPVRFTSAGRAVMDHQTELVVTGVGTLLLTVMLFLLTSVT
jgi:hypothetical protein